MSKFIRQIAIVAICVLCYGVSAHAFVVDGIRYEQYRSGTTSGSDQPSVCVIGLADYPNEVISVDIPKEVIYINEYTNEETVYEVVAIASRAFDGYRSDIPASVFSTVSLPSTIQIIESGAFINYAIEQLTLRSGCTISEEAFAECVIGEINIESATPPVACGWSFFYRNKPLYEYGCTLSIPEDALDAYLSNEYWRNYLTRIAENDYVYRIDFDSKEATIYGYTGSKDITTLALPEKMIAYEEEYDVTGIGESVFTNCANLRKLTIPGSYETIGKSAFSGLAMLSELSLPQSITSIGRYAFSGCSALMEFESPDNLEYIGEDAFANCINLSRLEIGRNVKSIQEGAFYNTPLASIECYAADPPAGQPFSRDVQVSAKITVPENSLESYKSADGWAGFWNVCKFDSLFYEIDSEKGCASVTYSYPGLGDRNYVNVAHEVAVADKVVVNGKEYPVKYIGKDAFSNVVYPQAADGYYAVDSSRAVDNNFYITKVAVPQSVVEIQENAMAYCYIEDVELADGLMLIGKAAFESSGIDSIILPNSVVVLEEGCFYGCGNLTNVVIGSSVKRIGSNAFGSCYDLSRIRCLGEVPPLVDSSSFDYNTYINAYLEVPEEVYYDYMASEVWSQFENVQQFADVEEIAGEEKYPCNYYDLRGCRVYPPILTPGIYIRRNGSDTVKIFVK